MKDPICGMEVSDKSKFKSARNGKTYYFCSQSCKDRFDSSK
ncbi:MAG: YHS domain-containing protein [Candidatus Micrarchaeota archaeon]|nr:YHS domain-containing protein [Candidatus Micrarchaeota archaeon]MDE1823844.1 YHS domain-containing protein [Candidatus Micrarchaeota archaeon]MDE1849466.1 YHS domain-containing protein [Candidatus Micrarchaeota archaeon]